MTVKTEVSAATKSKYDKAPIMSGCVNRFPRAIKYIAEISQWGAQKHQVSLSARGFLKISDAENVYRDAMGRHIVEEQIFGKHNEDDNSFLHVGQVAWNALAVLEVVLSNWQNEDAFNDLIDAQDQETHTKHTENVKLKGQFE